MLPEELVTNIKGVGDATTKKLNRLGVHQVIDLIRLIPRRYIDYSNPQTISEINQDQKSTSFIASITEPKSFYTKNGKLITQSTAEDSTGKIKLIWFNNPYIKKLIKPNSTYTIAGQVNNFSGSLCLISPTIEEGSSFSLNTKGLVPIYPQTNGLKSNLLRKYVFYALQKVKLQDPLMRSALTVQSTSIIDAYQKIHFPHTKTEKKIADKRLSFNEHLKICLTNQIELQKLGNAPSIAIDPKIHQLGLDKLPFKLTLDQEKATKQILKDLTKNHFTHRLIQGDTGSGKTATVILASNQTIASNTSCAILAPTQILANQHYQSFKKYSLYPSKVVLITGQEKPEITKDPTIYIGTHSLLSTLNTQDINLAFLAIDEQHKFGVEQRDLFSKQKNPPHMINLSATPIPRTIAQGLLGEINISTIKTKPQDRLPIKTHIITPKYFETKGLPWLVKNIDQDNKVFVVAPNIYNNQNTTSVESLYQKYKAKLPNGIEICLLHGKLKPDQQNQIIDNFTKAKKAILIATSLIEVGIDIKSANIIIIHSAERFGLAQLHQLRGRVGRNNQQGYCFLIPTHDDQEETERLNLLTKHHSGLTLAKKDLILRGSGEIFGNKQHGSFQTRLKYFWSKKSYLHAKSVSKELTEKNPSEAKIIASLLNSC